MTTKLESYKELAKWCEAYAQTLIAPINPEAVIKMSEAIKDLLKRLEIADKALSYCANSQNYRPPMTSTACEIASMARTHIKSDEVV